MIHVTPQSPKPHVKSINFRHYIMALGLVVGTSGGFGDFSAISLSTSKAPENVQPKTTHRLFGKVIYWYTETPLAGVKVSVGKVSTLTDAKGKFELNIPVPTDKKQKYYKINFSKKGYQPDYLDSIPLNSKREILIGLMKPLK